MEISGTVENVIFRNLENGYAVIDIDYNGELLTCVGNLGAVNEGEFLELVGDYVKNEKYGKQFAVKSLRVNNPNSLDGIQRYLSSGLIRGIGPVTANAIVEKFGLDTLDIIEFSPQRLAEVKGVSLAKAETISEYFNEIKDMQKAVMFLQEYDISTHMAVKIYNVYLERTISTLSANPYQLVEDVDGIGFLTADRIAKSMGVAESSEFRIRAGILHCLKESSDKGGNTCLPLDLLTEGTQKILNVDNNFEALFNNALESLFVSGNLKQMEKRGKTYVMLSKFYHLEQSIAQKVNMLLISPVQNDTNIDDEIAQFQKLNDITFHEDQVNAIKKCIANNVSIITGGPGTGKTTIIKCILNILRQFSKKIYLLAPTGRAAKRLSQSCGQEASTIHRALEVGYKEDDSSFFHFNEKNKLPAKVVIVDEVSMVDVPLMSSLVKALPLDCKLILVGDKDQLPSVGAGNVLHDLLESGIVEFTCLTQIYRQDEASLIVKNAHLINDGKMPEINNKSKDFFFEERKESESVLHTTIDLAINRLPKFLDIEPSDIQVLAPMRSGICGVNRLNKELQEIINPESLRKREIRLEINTFREGDKVMQIINNYEASWEKDNGRFVEKGMGVFNGDVGFIKSISETNDVEVIFDDGKRVVYPRGEIGQLVIAYATTIHKSQGSEFDVVILPLVAGSNLILTRNLLYTAVTRAKKMVVMVGSKQNLARMIYNNYTAKRYSMLKEFLIKQQKNTEFLYS